MLAEVEEETKRLTEEGENYFEFGKANCEFKYHEELSKMSNLPEETTNIKNLNNYCKIYNIH